MRVLVDTAQTRRAPDVKKARKMSITKNSVSTTESSLETCCSPGGGHLSSELSASSCPECRGSGYTYMKHEGYKSRRWYDVPDECPYCAGTGSLTTAMP